MNQQNATMAQQIAALLRTYEANEQFEGRDELFDLLVAAYEDELADAFARRGFLLVETAACGPRQQQVAVVVMGDLQARDLRGCAVSRYNATSHGGPAILVTAPGRERPILGVHMFPGDIKVIEQKDQGHTTAFPYEDVAGAVGFAADRALAFVSPEIAEPREVEL